MVADDHQYGYYKHYDSYPSGWPVDFLREAADVAREGSWEAVREDWLKTRWLGYEDNERSISKLSELTTRETGSPIDDVYEMKPKPGVRSIGSLPAVLKEVIYPEEEFNDREYAVVLDFDHNKIVMLKYMGPWREDELRYPDFRPVPIAQASLDDPEGMEDVIVWARANVGKSVEKLDPPPMSLPPAPHGRQRLYVHHEDPRFLFHSSVGGPELIPFDPYDTYESRVAEHLADFPPPVVVRDNASRRTGRDWPAAPHALRDGMWLRPEGFPPLEGTPASFPAMGPAASSGDGFRAPGAQGSNGTMVNGQPCCTHIGQRNGKPCVRPPHEDRHHRYQ